MADEKNGQEPDVRGNCLNGAVLMALYELGYIVDKTVQPASVVDVLQKPAVDAYTKEGPHHLETNRKRKYN